jgi:hypothetical protein
MVPAHPRNSWLKERCGMSLAELQGKPIATVLIQPSKKVIKARAQGRQNHPQMACVFLAASFR